MTATVNCVILLTIAINVYRKGRRYINTENFDKLPEEKRHSILNAAFTCFGRDGYKKTAISEIANMAGISKAAIFHYFGTKRNFYLYLFSFSCNEILAKMESGTDDFFECLRIGTQFKLNVMEKHPGMFDFLFSLVKEEDAELIADVKKINVDGIDKGVVQLFARVDWNRFRPDINKEEANKLVSWVSDGYIRTYAGIKDGQKMAAEIDHYMEILKRAIYKEEYL